jgi:hypothetical protein
MGCGWRSACRDLDTKPGSREPRTARPAPHHPSSRSRSSIVRPRIRSASNRSAPTRISSLRSESSVWATSPSCCVVRFDREKVPEGYHRHRMVSALTMLDAEKSPTDTTNWSYLLLADELQRWSSRPREDRAELFSQGRLQRPHLEQRRPPPQSFRGRCGRGLAARTRLRSHAEPPAGSSRAELGARVRAPRALRQVSGPRLVTRVSRSRSRLLHCCTSLYSTVHFIHEDHQFHGVPAERLRCARSRREG